MSAHEVDETTLLAHNETILSVAHDIVRFTRELGPDQGLQFAIHSLRTAYAAGMVKGTDIALAAIREETPPCL